MFRRGSFFALAPREMPRLVSTLAVVLAVGLVLLILNSIRSTTTTTTVRAVSRYLAMATMPLMAHFSCRLALRYSRAATSSRWDLRR